MSTDPAVFFREIGFSENEIKVYLGLLDLGQSTIGPISAKSSVQPTKAYLALDRLVERGLVSYVHKSHTKYFQTSDPQTILGIVMEQEEKAKAILPYLKQKQKNPVHVRDAELYDGKSAIRSLYDTLIDSMVSGDYYYAFALKNEYPLSESAQLFFRQKHQLLSQKGIDDRIIVHEDVRADFDKIFADIPGVKICYVNADLPIGLAITKGRVINTIWHGQPTAIEIRSERLAEQYKKFFLHIWNQHCEKE